MEIMTGFAQQCITPALPVGLAGFGTKRTAEAVLDDLFVKAAVYQREDGIYGILAFDLIAVDELIIRRMKDGMEAMHLKQENFLFTATHTHSGPGGGLKTGEGLLAPSVGIFLETNPALIEEIAESSLQALREAVAGLKRTAVLCARGTLEQVGDNRNSRELEGDNRIAAAFLEQEEGKRAVIWHFACHPTVLNGANERISADFPGAAAACMKEQGYEVCMFVNGSCGDISTRFSRRGSHEGELLRFGRIFQDALLTLRSQAKPVKIGAFAAARNTCRLKVKQAEGIKQAQARLDACNKRLREAKQNGADGAYLRVLESYREGAESSLALAQKPYSVSGYEVPVQFVRINRHVFVCIPGELFSELSNPLRDGRMHFIGYANGYAGYFADEAAYDRFYYEAQSSPFQRGEGEQLMRFAARAAEELPGKEE